MAARHFLNRGRSIRSSFGVSNIFAFNLLGGQFCKSTSHSNLLMLRSYATKSEAEKQNLKLGRIIKEDSDASIRKGPFELVYLLVHENNVKALTKYLIDYLERRDLDFKCDLTAKICSMVQKFSREKIWYSDQRLKVLSELCRNSFANEVFQHQVGSSEVIASTRQFIHGTCVRKAFDMQYNVNHSTREFHSSFPRAEFHSSSSLHARHPTYSRDLKRGDKMKLEIRFFNTPSGFVIHNISPAEIIRNQVAKYSNGDSDFIEKWKPFIEVYVKTLPVELRAVMDKHWVSKWEGASNDSHRALQMLRHGVKNKLPLFDNYWDETVEIAKLFLEEDGIYSFGKMLKKFPRGGIYDCETFVNGFTETYGRRVSIRFKDDEGEIVAEEFMFLVDEERKLIDHPGGYRGNKNRRQFVFKG